MEASDTSEAIEELVQRIQEAKSIVFFGGAGVSTESQIPDFRSEQGIYKTVSEYGMPPEQIISHSFFYQNMETFYDFYKKHMVFREAQPNDAHKALAKLEAMGKIKAVITQNIDGLHQMAGSKTVYEIHGSVHRNYCTHCHAFYDLDYIVKADGIPKCNQCGHVIKPDVVLYEEALDDHVMIDSIEAIRQADMMIVGGTSLSVYPAAGLINYYQGDNLVLINKGETPYDSKVDLRVKGNIGEVFHKVMEEMEPFEDFKG